MKNANKVNAQLADLSRIYHNAIPLNVIFDVCRAQSFEPVQEDGTPWAGLLCGREGRADIELTNTRKWLHLQWFKMEHTGRYEINAYIA
jgi:hypothetical protein